MMAKYKLFGDEEIDSLLSLINIVDSADLENKVYNVSSLAYDNLKDLINCNEKISKEKKKELLEKFNSRKKNQQMVEELSKEANDTKRVQALLNNGDADV